MGTVITLIMAAFIVKLAVRFGKKEITAAGCFLASGILAVAYFVHTENVYVWIFFYAVATVGLAVFGLIGWAMVSAVSYTHLVSLQPGEAGFWGFIPITRVMRTAIMT